jgi:GxxExxY protein
MTKREINDITYAVIGAAIEVHKNIGQGLLEGIYHKCMEHELSIRNINYKTEMAVPVSYKGINLFSDLRCDFFVEDCLLVELKAVDKVIPSHEAQLMTYMKLLKAPKGIIINFNCFNLFKDGQRTYVTELYKALSD